MQIAHEREGGGQLVRAAWIAWVQTQPDPKPSWLVPWEELSEPDKEADRVIWETIARPYIKVIRDKQESIDRLRERLEEIEEQFSYYWPD
jgi:hypothetical protein